MRVVVAGHPVDDRTRVVPAPDRARLAEQPDDERIAVVGRQREAAERRIGGGGERRIVRLEAERLGHQAVAADDGLRDGRCGS